MKQKPSFFSITIISNTSEPLSFNVKKTYFWFMLCICSLGLLAAVFFGAGFFVQQNTLSDYKDRVEKTEKLNESLNALVTRQFQNDFLNLNYKFSFNKSGQLAIVGKNGTDNPQTNQKLFVTKYDNGRELLWTKYFGREREESVLGVVYNFRNQIFVLSCFLETGPDGKIAKRNRIYVFDDNGKILKTQTLAENGNLQLFDMKNDYRGRLYLAGMGTDSAANSTPRVFVKAIEVDKEFSLSDFIALQEASVVSAALRKTETLSSGYASFDYEEKEIPPEILEEVRQKTEAENLRRERLSKASEKDKAPSAPQAEVAQQTPKENPAVASTQTETADKPNAAAKQPVRESPKTNVPNEGTEANQTAAPAKTVATKKPEKPSEASAPKPKTPPAPKAKAEQVKSVVLKNFRINADYRVQSPTFRRPKTPKNRVVVDLDLIHAKPQTATVYMSVVLYNSNDRKYAFRPLERGVFNRRGYLSNSLRATKLNFSGVKTHYRKTLNLNGEDETYNLLGIFLFDSQGEEIAVTKVRLNQDIFTL